jgi:hypothetical protein
VAIENRICIIHMFKHRATAVATQTAPVSLNVFKHRDTAVVTKTSPVSLNLFNHRAKQWPNKEHSSHPKLLK